MKNTKNKFNGSQGQIISLQELHKIYFKNRWLLGSKFDAKKLAILLIDAGYLKQNENGALIIINLPNPGFVNDLLSNNAVLLPQNRGASGALKRLLRTTLLTRSLNAVLIGIFLIFQLLVWLEWGRPVFSRVKQNFINTVQGVSHETK